MYVLILLYLLAEVYTIIGYEREQVKSKARIHESVVVSIDMFWFEGVHEAKLILSMLIPNLILIYLHECL